jgi:hypothetical protein
MIELIALIIFIVSLLGIFFIVGKKVPVLVKLPQHGHHGIKKHALIVKIENKIKHHHFHLFEKQMLLHKILSFVKVWTLKIERRIDTLLHGIRKKAQELDKKHKGKK